MGVRVNSYQSHNISRGVEWNRFGVLQVSFAGNTEVMPENTVHCWDMVESTGALNPLAGEWDGDSIISIKFTHH